MKKIIKTIKVLFILALLIAIPVIIGMTALGNGKQKLEYRTDVVTRGNIKQIVTANGTLNPTVIADVGTQVSGKVTKLYADVNDEVKEGQLIAEIDPSLIETEIKQSKSQLEIARINYEQAQRDYNRSRELFKKDYIARVEVEQAHQSLMSQKLSYESAQAALEQVKVNLGYTKITSPIDGVIIAKEVTEGQTVASSLQAPTLFKIAASLVDMKIDVTIPESDIGQLKEGMPVTFTVDTYPDKEFSGTLSSININPDNDGMVVTYSGEVLFKNEERILFPGMTAYVSVTLTEKKDVLRVPAAAFRFQPPKQQESGIKNLFNPSSRYRRWRSSQNQNEPPSIYLLKGNQPQKVEVQPGMMDDFYMEIQSDQVKEGDKVILSIFEQED